MALVDVQAEIAYAGDADRAAEQVRVALCAKQGEVAAKTPADDRGAPRIGDPLRDCPACAVDDVLVGEPAPVLVGGEEPVGTVTARTAEIHLQHGIAAADQEFAQEEIAPGIA